MTNPMVAKVFVSLAAALAAHAPAFSAGADTFNTPAGMRCEDAVLVRYHPSVRWAEVEQEIGGHLDFMRAQMRAGRVLFGGPFYESGGIDVFRGADLAAVAALTETDPLVSRKVVTYSMERFWMCTGDAPRHSRQTGASELGNSARPRATR